VPTAVLNARVGDLYINTTNGFLYRLNSIAPP
jgi:hypothetical protein